MFFVEEDFPTGRLIGFGRFFLRPLAGSPESEGAGDGVMADLAGGAGGGDKPDRLDGAGDSD